MSSKYLIRVGLSIILLVGLCLVVLVRLPVSSLISWDEYQVTATDIDHSTIFGGEMYLELAQVPTLGRVLVNWQWCPGLQLMSWCVDLQARDFDFDGRVSLGFSSLSIQAAELQLSSLTPVGVTPSLASLQASAQIEELTVSDFSCPAGSLERLVAHAGIVDITFFGSSLGEASLSATATQGVSEATLDGDFVSGSFQANTLDYSGVFAVIPTSELEPLFGQFGQPDSDGEYEWTVSGRLPCGWS